MAKTTTVEDNQLHSDQKVTWAKWYLQKSSKQHSVKAIVDSVDEQYTEEKKMEYVGYSNKTTHSMFDQIQTWVIVLNK